jgi:hypothetical protein
LKKQQMTKLKLKRLKQNNTMRVKLK